MRRDVYLGFMNAAGSITAISSFFLGKVFSTEELCLMVSQ